ncbi:hypothetical protein [Streptomyces sp. NBC_00286]|uniref:hypothetical protein n=1 Tax=Streptomyces sp. NBC_00286 TaxID=2975701 RepID=UPI003FA68509
MVDQFARFDFPACERVLKGGQDQVSVRVGGGLPGDHPAGERLKGWRGIATRFDKTPESYLACLHLRASMIWINDLATR